MDLILCPVWIAQLSNTFSQVMLGQSLCLLEWDISFPGSFEQKNNVIHVFISQLCGNSRCFGKKGMRDRASPDNSCLVWWQFNKSENSHVMNKVQARLWWPGYPATGSSLIRKRPCLPPPRVWYSRNTKLVIILIPHPVVVSYPCAFGHAASSPLHIFLSSSYHRSTNHRPTPFAPPWVNLLIIQGSA